MKYIYLATISLFAMAQLSAQSIIGSWEGDLNVQGTTLPLIFHISQEGDQYAATLDSPKQGAFGIKASATSYEGEVLKITFSSMGATFEGGLEEDQLKGTFNQAGFNLPMELSRKSTDGSVTETDTSKVRPQDPKPPFPYAIEEVSFPNPQAGGIRLAGTLTYPKEVQNPVTVILISGSGPQNRDEEIMNHRPFWVWADHLSRQGIAVLRYDDRGVAESEGDFATSTSEDFTQDVEAAIQFLKKREGFEESSIGLMGHSEGGMIAPMVAAGSKEVDFAVLLAAPGVPIIDLMVLQNEKIMGSRGLSGADKEAFINQQKQVFELVKNSGGLEKAELEDALLQLYEKLNGGADLKDNPQIQGALKQLSAPWMRYFMAYDPTSNLKKMACPVLAINGDKDLQVVAEQNIPAIEAALKNGKSPNYETKIFPSLNHLFQKAETGAVSEYATISETINPEVLTYVSDWILQTVKK